jgi:hypothetical protein
MYWPASNRGMMFSARSARQQQNSERGMMFSVRSVSRCYKQYNWNSELIVGQSPAGKNLSMEAKDIVGIRHKARTGEGIEN